MRKITPFIFVPLWLFSCYFTSGCFANSQPHRVARVVDATQPDSTGNASQSSVRRAERTVPAQTAGTHGNGGTKAPQPYVETASASSGETYTVKSGDTMYSIAFRFNQDYHQLAKRNGVEPPYAIKQGQVLKISDSKPQIRTPVSARNTSQPSNLPFAVPLAQARAEKEQALKQGKKTLKYKVKTGDSVNSVARSYEVSLDELVKANKLSAPYYLKRGSIITIPLNQTARANVSATSASAPTLSASKGKALSTTTIVTEHGTTIRDQVVEQKEEIVPVAKAAPKIVRLKSQKVSGIVWQWPASGKLIKTFSTAEHGSKGIDIKGNYAQDIMSSADGEVVYAGNALRGYGNLVIVNHANEYMSAYAHNEELLVREGQTVKRGQVIARMGSTDADKVMLHFEIRHKGSSVDPQKFLP